VGKRNEDVQALEVITSNTNEQRRAVLRNYRDTYFTKDLLLLSNIENADALMAILAYLAVALGSHVDGSNVARESGLSYPTARKYLNVLIAARLVFKLYGYHYGPAKRFTRAAKYYFSDIGILEALGVAVSEGQRLEAFVVSELEKRRRLGGFDCASLGYYKSAGGAEIDIIIDEPNRVTAVEIKASRNPSYADTRHLRTFIQNPSDARQRRAVLIFLGEQQGTDHGVELLPVAHLRGAL